MPNIVVKKQQQILAETLCKKTHFTKQEVETLLVNFRKVKKEDGPAKLDRNTFRDVLQNTFMMTDDIIMDRVFRAFDKDMDSFISMEEWVCGLSVFLRGTLDEKMAFCFDVYDLNSDGHISREEMFHMLKCSLVKQSGEEDPDEGIKDLVELTLKKMDYDHDNRISFTDYKTAVLEETLLLEALGTCLPDHKSAEAFQCLFSNTDTVH